MSEPAVELRKVTLAYGEFLAVKEVDLRIEQGSFVTLLGPSGCGKTTILRAIAGLVSPRSGEIRIKGREVNDVPIHIRNIGLVFQNYALFPHRNVFDNIAFGLKYRKIEKALIAEKVRRSLDMVRLPGVERKLPSELSGGQQQRIALARAIVIEPDVLLLDEPLSALDANLREEMRSELKMIQRQVGITTIFVTHDQEEALAMSDRVVVMNHGLIEQEGTPEDVYRQPASRFVASFLGQSNILAGRVVRGAGGEAEIAIGDGERITLPARRIGEGEAVSVVVRAQRIGLGAGQPAPGALRLAGRIVSTSYLGGTAAYLIDAGGLRLQAVTMIEGRVYREGEPVEISIAPGDCTLLDGSGARIGA